MSSFVQKLQKVPLYLCGLFVLADQLVKYYIVAYRSDVFLCNNGVAFGVEVPRILFLVMWGGIMCAVLYYWAQHRADRFAVQLPFVLVAAGGVGNMIDRLLYGCVIDYIPFFSLSSFNVADALISCGALLWVWRIFFTHNTHNA